MKIQYKTVTKTVVSNIDDDHWGQKILEENRLELANERRHWRSDHKYAYGKTVTLDEAESDEFNNQRKHKRGRVNTDDIVNGIIKAETYARLHNSVRALPTEQRELITALFFTDIKAMDYAKTKGITKSAVSHMLNRALRNLKNSFI